MSESEIRALRHVESIRLRPAMYVGSTGLFGLVNYCVCPVAAMLSRGAKRIDVEISDRFKISSEVPINLTEKEGRIVALQDGGSDDFDIDLTILNGLSSELIVAMNSGEESQSLQFERGVLTSRQTNVATTSVGTTLWFQPDTEIFSNTDLSASAFESYLRRLSFLHQGTRFSLTVSGVTQSYFEEDGIGALFRKISSPFQLMHEPIRISGQDGALKLQLIMAHQSWSHNHIWCFINNGRAVDGGTHEQGLFRGIKRLHKKLGVPETFENGVVAVAFLHYPNVVWKGCIKSKIGSPELRPMVARLVANESLRWFDEHPQVHKQVKVLQRFQFPAIWTE